MKDVFLKGMTYGWGSKRGEYRTEYAEDSMRKLAETGSEWIALSFWTWQDTVHSTEIHYDYGYTVTDRDLAHAVQLAKQLGLKVCLKPVVNSRDGIWRARIGFPEEGEIYWAAWFRSYTNFIKHYAELAEDLECEMFCIGCEMVGTESRTAEWRQLIQEVTNLYTGPIIYNANHGKEEGIEWLDEVDFIGTSAYYPVASVPGDSYENMLAGWERQKPRLKSLSERFGKPLVFIEIDAEVLMDVPPCHGTLHTQTYRIQKMNKPTSIGQRWKHSGMNLGLPVTSGGTGARNYMPWKRLPLTVVLIFMAKKPNKFSKNITSNLSLNKLIKKIRNFR